MILGSPKGNDRENKIKYSPNRCNLSNLPLKTATCIYDSLLMINRMAPFPAGGSSAPNSIVRASWKFGWRGCAARHAPSPRRKPVETRTEKRNPKGTEGRIGSGPRRGGAGGKVRDHQASYTYMYMSWYQYWYSASVEKFQRAAAQLTKDPMLL